MTSATDPSFDRLDRVAVVLPDMKVSFQRTRLVDDVCAQLREWIINGDLLPGTRLLQSELATQLGVSRTPLREAFRVLERDGLIRISNGNKTVEVVAPDTDEIIELYEFREVIDGLAARLLARQGPSEKILGLLDKDVRSLEDAVLPSQMSAFSQAHAHFHGTIAENCGNRRVVDLSPVVQVTSQVILARRIRSAPESPELLRIREAIVAEGNADHRRILSCIARGDEDEAEAAAREHIHKATRTLRRLEAKLPGSGPPRG
jgi:GntR family transcriptional regulator, vanillate catabolism transcriptional regulator